MMMSNDDSGGVISNAAEMDGTNQERDYLEHHVAEPPLLFDDDMHMYCHEEGKVDVGHLNLLSSNLPPIEEQKLDVVTPIHQHQELDIEDLLGGEPAAIDRSPSPLLMHHQDESPENHEASQIKEISHAAEIQLPATASLSAAPGSAIDQSLLQQKVSSIIRPPIIEKQNIDDEDNDGDNAQKSAGVSRNNTVLRQIPYVPVFAPTYDEFTKLSFQEYLTECEKHIDPNCGAFKVSQEVHKSTSQPIH